MGEVYVALRDDAGFSQHGALKLLRFEAIGELARFHTERQILVRLDHPGIARLLDGGAAPDGRPYTVMEYIDGASLIDWCNTRQGAGFEIHCKKWEKLIRERTSVCKQFHVPIVAEIRGQIAHATPTSVCFRRMLSACKW